MTRTVPATNAGNVEIVGFVGLVLGLSWSQFVPPLLEGTLGVELPDATGAALNVLFVASPTIAALLLVGRRSNTEDVALFLRDRLRWRVPLAWYLVALVLLPSLAGSALAVLALRGEPVPRIDSQTVLLVVQVFTVGAIANLSENYGWRGYLQEGLQSTHSAVAASLAVGGVWGLWHAPLFLLGGGPQSAIPYGWYMVLIVGLAVVFGWVYNETRGSVVLVTLMHCTFNASSGPVLLSLVAAGRDVRTFVALYAAVVCVAVVVILSWTSTETLTSSTAGVSSDE